MPADPHRLAERELAPGVRNLLSAADEVIAMAKDFQAGGRDGDALACAMFAAEYVRAAKAMQAMHEASEGLDTALRAKEPDHG